ncbi:MAG: outer membrane lipoprotein-sorting protein [Pseudomonadota bacterium]
MTRILRQVLILVLYFLLFSGSGLADQKETGLNIMEEVFKRHELFPFSYEEQTMIMTDSAGNQDVRKVRQFLRVEADKTVKYLLVFDNPTEIRGVAMRVIQYPDGLVENAIFLPAFGKELATDHGKSQASYLLGTDFALEDVIKTLADFQYVRQADQKIARIDYFVVDAFPLNQAVQQNSGYSRQRHFIGQDNFFIVRTDYFDRSGRLFKRLSRHDLNKMTQQMWRANMILMENFRESHTTLIKIDRRIFSGDYVPSHIFTRSWLQENQHIQGADNRFLSQAFGRIHKPSEDKTEIIMGN